MPRNHPKREMFLSEGIGIITAYPSLTQNCYACMLINLVDDYVEDAVDRPVGEVFFHVGYWRDRNSVKKEGVTFIASKDNVWECYINGEDKRRRGAVYRGPLRKRILVIARRTARSLDKNLQVLNLRNFR